MLGYQALPLACSFSLFPGLLPAAGSASTTVARSLIHSSAVIGRSLMMYRPTAASICQASRQRAELRFFRRFFSQKIAATSPRDWRRGRGRFPACHANRPGQ
jgi:hypothetical protein